MMGLTVRYTGSKDDVITEMRERADEAKESGRAAANKETKARHSGVAEGYERAARLLERWTPPEAASENGDQPAWKP